MEKFTTHTGLVVPLDSANVDTDQIIPKQFLKSIKRTGFGPSLFFDWRYDDRANPDPDFELNALRFEGKSILVTRNNFGCGSSREHAVWALAQDGYRVVVAPAQGEGDARVPGFADIFRNNCGKNGLVTIELTEAEVEEIFQLVAANEGLEATVDLPAQTITFLTEENHVYGYAFDAAIKESMVKGLDDIAQTLEHAPDVSAFECTHDTLIDLPD